MSGKTNKMEKVITKQAFPMLAEELMVSEETVRGMAADLSEISRLIGRPFGVAEMLAAASGAFELLKQDAQADT